MSYKSKFLCSCNELLYFDIKTKEEFCLNPSCANYVDERLRDNPEPFNSQYNTKFKSLLLKIRTFNKDSFLHYLGVLREKLILDYFNMTGMNIQLFYAVNELLRILATPSRSGRINSQKKFTEVVNEFKKMHDMKNFLDEVLNKKYVLTDKGRVLVLKYASTFQKMFANYGIIDLKKRDDPDTFKYDKVDFKNDFDKEYKEGDDLLKYYKRFYRLMVTIDYFLNYHYEQSKTYNYDFNKRDIAFLLSFFYSAQADVSEPPKANFFKHLTVNCSDTTTHDHLIKTFVECTDQVPVIIKKSNSYLVGRMTTLFFVFYLMGLYSKDIVQEGKKVASEVFEDEIRKELRLKDYVVPFDEEFKISKKAPYSYDVIAYSKERKEILLIEVKYKDIPSSSINGKTLIDQELHAKNGLINMASKQKERIDHFKENIDSYNEKIGIKNIEEYELKAFLITKYIPLIEEHESIPILELGEFLSII